MPRRTWAFICIIFLSALSCAVEVLAQTYTYDELGRVVSVEYGTTQTGYAYDSTDNRTSAFIGSNTAPVCSSPTYNMPGIPNTATVSISITAAAILNLSSDPDGDSLTILTPATLPKTFTLSASQSVTTTYTVTDGKGGVCNGSINYSRP